MKSNKQKGTAQKKKGKRPNRVARRPNTPAGVAAQRPVASSSSSSRPILDSRQKAVIPVTPAGADYITAVFNPRDGPLCHLPWGFPLRSRVFRTKATGTFTSGAGGVPFVAVNPWAMCSSNGIASATYFIGSIPAVVSSSSSYVSDASTPFGTNGTGVTLSYPNSDYTYNSLTGDDDIQIRLVSCGLYVWNTTALLSRAGTYCAYCETGHGTLAITGATGGSNANSSDSPTNISSREEVKRVAIGSGNTPVVVLYGAPASEEETNFLSLRDLQQQLANWTAAGLTVAQAANNAVHQSEFRPAANYSMVFFSLDGAQQVYTYEAYAIFEILGHAVTGKSPGSLDMNAFNLAAVASQLNPGGTFHSPPVLQNVVKSATDMIGRASPLVRAGMAAGSAAYNFGKALGAF